MSEPPRRLLILLMGESLRSTVTGIAVGARRASPRQSESQALGPAPAPAPAPARAHPDLHRRSQQRGAAGAGEATRAFPAQTEPRPQRRTRGVCAGDSSQESERPRWSSSLASLSALLNSTATGTGTGLRKKYSSFLSARSSAVVIKRSPWGKRKNGEAR